MSITAQRYYVSGLLVLLSGVAPASGQWTGDPNVNLSIADLFGEQAQPLIQPTADGGCYVSWLDNATGGYDVYLQRLDAGGNEQWPHNGILIADRSFSSTQAYGLSIDTAGNALLAFRDDRFDGIQITASKVSPAGNLLWGGDGVQMTSTADFVASPRIAGTTDGRVVAAWTQEGTARLHKLTPSGTPAWLNPVTISDAGSEAFAVSDLQASNDGGVIVALVRGFFGATLHAQKLAANGAFLWGANPVAVFDGGALQVANFPTFVPDGSGGAVFGWYGVGPLQCYVQHILSNGAEKFTHDGVAASTNAARLRVAPSVSYHSAADEIFLFWPELNSLQSEFGIYGQKYAPDGTRQWGNEGRQLVPLDSNERTQIRNLQLADGAMVFWVEALGFGDDRLKAARVDTAGDFVWAPGIIEASSTAADKSRLAAALSTGQFAMLVFQDDLAGDYDIVAQNVNPDGSLGAPACAPDLDGNGVVEAADLAALLGAWGPNAGHAADFDDDDIVSASDLAILLGALGTV